MYLKLLFGVLFIFNSLNSYSQELLTEEQLSRKVIRLQNAERDLYRLPFEKSFIRETLAPEVLENRNELAPHFPNTPSASKEIREERLRDWIVQYEQEYSDFIRYFEIFIRSHF